MTMPSINHVVIYKRFIRILSVPEFVLGTRVRYNVEQGRWYSYQGIYPLREDIDRKEKQESKFNTTKERKIYLYDRNYQQIVARIY